MLISNNLLANKLKRGAASLNERRIDKLFSLINVVRRQYLIISANAGDRQLGKHLHITQRTTCNYGHITTWLTPALPPLKHCFITEVRNNETQAALTMKHENNATVLAHTYVHIYVCIHVT